MTWLEAALKASAHWGLEEDIKESYYKHIKEGKSASEAAHNACYDWDIYLPQNILDQVTEVE